jgi:thiamine biosynthesis lipoprotein
MNSSSPHAAPDRPFEGRFADLLEMGFERIDPAPETIESIRLDAATYKLTQIRAAMGSFVSITALDRSEARAAHAIGTAFEEMDRLIGLFNRFASTSALSHLNDTGRLVDAPSELVEVIRSGLRFGRLTNGAFDITVKPLIDLFRDPVTYAPKPSRPAPEDVRAALELVGNDRVAVADNRVRLTRAGMGVTLDGIAKGYVVDSVASWLRRQKISNFLINAGGDIRAAGNRGDGAPWAIALRDPEDTEPSWRAGARSGVTAPTTVPLSSGAVATSGSYETYFDRERLSHHIVRAGDGASPQAAVSVTVVAPTTLHADALATAVFVLGPARGKHLIEQTPGCECFVIDRHGERTRSNSWPDNAPSTNHPA